MTMDNNAEVKTQGDAPPEVSAQEKLTKLESELATARQELTKWQEEAKTHQRTASKKAQEAQVAQQLLERIDKLEKVADVQTKMVASILDRDEVEEETPRRKRSEAYLADLPKPKEESKSKPDEAFTRAALEADVLAKSAGLDMESSEELTKSLNFFLRGKHEEGLAEVKRVVEGKKAKMTEQPKAKTLEEKTIKELTEEEWDEKLRERMEKKGLLVTDLGKPAGGSGSKTLEQLTKTDIRNMNPKQLAEHKDKLLSALKTAGMR